MEIIEAASCLSALGQNTRLSVFRLLVQAGEEGVSAGDIAKAVEVFPNTLSAHLNILGHAGLIRSRREGRSVYYTANYEQTRNLIAYLLQDCCHGVPELCTTLTDYLEICR